MEKEYGGEKFINTANVGSAKVCCAAASGLICLACCYAAPFISKHLFDSLYLSSLSSVVLIALSVSLSLTLYLLLCLLTLCVYK